MCIHVHTSKILRFTMFLQIYLNCSVLVLKRVKQPFHGGWAVYYDSEKF